MQRAEQQDNTSNLLVGGSNPSGRTEDTVDSPAVGSDPASGVRVASGFFRALSGPIDADDGRFVARCRRSPILSQRADCRLCCGHVGGSWPMTLSSMSIRYSSSESPRSPTRMS